MTQKYEKSSEPLSKKQIIFNNFLGGIFWALGATVGVGLIFALLGFLAKNVDFVPVVGSFVSDIIDFILSTNQNLRK